MKRASEVLTQLRSLDCQVVQPTISHSGQVRFTVYRVTDLSTMEEWVEIAEECRDELGATVDTVGLHSEANFHILVPEEEIEFDIREGEETISTGYN